MIKLKDILETIYGPKDMIPHGKEEDLAVYGHNESKRIKPETVKKYYEDFKKLAIEELFDKPAKHVEQTSPITYLVSDEGIEAEYRFRKEDGDRSWSLHWDFTDDNVDYSSKAWTLVTSSCFKVLESFIEQQHPLTISISGNTQSKSNLYASTSFIKNLSHLFGEDYVITVDRLDDGSPYAIQMIDKSITHKDNIRSRMETMNESYEQALNYWKHGDLNSVSRIERWDTIKRKVRKEVVRSLYLK